MIRIRSAWFTWWLAAAATLAACTATAPSPETPAEPLAGPVWAWQESMLKDGGRIAPDASEHYTLEFTEDARVRVQVDCNRGGGGYEVAGANLSVGPLATTRMACPSGSLDTRFLQQLAAVDTYRVRNGELVLTLRYAGGTMRFRPLLR